MLNKIIFWLNFGFYPLMTLALFISSLYAVNVGLKRAHVTYRTRKRTTGILITIFCLWISYVSALSLSGFLNDFNSLPPRLAFIFAPVLLMITWAVFKSRKLRLAVKSIKGQWLVRIQSYRILVELSLWSLFISGRIPASLTFEGYNWDILAGLTAPLIAWIGYAGGKERKPLLIVWNLVGLGLLINIIARAILSAPYPFRQFFEEPANTVVAEFPIVFLPAFVAPFALFLHVASLKRLLAKG